MTVLGTVIIRIAAIVRGIALAYVIVQLFIWHSFYLARPWFLVGPAVALAWGCAAIARLRRYPVRWPLICIDTAVYVALAVGAGWCVPLAIRGEAGSWLFIVVASQLVIPIWFAPPGLSLPLALASGAAFGAGAALTSAGQHAAGGDRAASVALLLTLVAVHWCGRRMLYGRASRADAALAAADLDARDQYVILSRNVERREHDRLLHDTVLNTLTAIARSGDTRAVVSACRNGIVLLERALSEPGDPAAGRPGGDLLAAIDAVVGEMRARGLAVHLEVTDSVPPDADVRLPGPVTVAVAHAAREALVNVAAHAGTGEAWVTVSLTPLGDAAPGGLSVTIRDAGAGFDLGHVRLARLGVRCSITERIADVGGSASVHSALGEGTVVRLCWPAAHPGSGLPAAGEVTHEGTDLW
jgi:signal transduction histidine kinase